jgi:hypothetical protein
MSVDYLSGDGGDVTHPWRRLKRAAGELAFGAVDLVAPVAGRADRLAGAQEPRSLLAIGVYRPGSLMPGAAARLESERHRVRIALGAMGEADPALADLTVADGLAGGKFGNLNRVLAAAGGPDADWILAVDDDVALPPRFLDRFVALCEHFRLDLAQPAQTQRSHSAWRVTRKRPGSLVRETRFVEIGPLTAFGRRAAAELMPFPDLRYGWGLDLHWSAIAAERGWRLGVVDATAVSHRSATVGEAYPRADAEAEAERFLADRPYLPAVRAAEVIATHRRVD